MKAFKKLRITIVSLLLINLFCFSAGAETLNPSCGWFSMLEVDGTEVCFLENEYYRVQADYYGEKIYQSVKADADNTKIDREFYVELKTAQQERYVSVVFADEAKSDADVRGALQKLTADENIIAVCPSYPVAMLKLASGSDVLEKLLEADNVVAVAPPFGMDGQQGKEYFVVCTEMRETYAPKASDARAILRYAAKIDQAPADRKTAKRFFFMCDADLNGVINAADARSALRIAAGLETGKTYYKSSAGSGQFWEF